MPNDTPHVRRTPARPAADTVRPRRATPLVDDVRRRTAAVHLARALAQRPQLLLLDEPTNHLDLHHQIGFLATVAGLGLTTIAVLHDLDLAAAFCPRMVVLSQGQVVAAGPTAQVLTSDLVGRVFGVQARIEDTDRLRGLWSGL